MTGRRAIVIGVGSRWRHDDGVGAVVAAEVAALLRPGVEVVVCTGECTELMDLWAGADIAVVVDAEVRHASDPGSIRCLGEKELADSEQTSVSSHSPGLVDAVRLGRALGRLPGRLVVVAAEAARWDIGSGLSEAVAAAVPRVVGTVLGELDRNGTDGSRPVRRPAVRYRGPLAR
ncbi:hydrogenase maturation protease [Nocardia sp. NPDC003345]